MLVFQASHEAHEGGLGEGFAGEFAHLGAFAEDDDAAGEIHEFWEFGGYEEDGGAFAGELIEKLVNFAFRADIHAAGGFIDNEDFAVAGEPFGECDFLLITAAQAGDLSFEAGSFHTQFLGVLLRESAFILLADEAEGREIGQGSERGVLAAIHGEDESLAFAIFGEKTDSRRECLLWRADGEFVAANEKTPGATGIESENGLGDFAAASADESAQAKDFAFAQCEVNVAKFSG